MAVLQPFLPIFWAIYTTSFTKLNIRLSFWGAEHVSILIGSKVMTEMKNMQKCEKRKNHQKHYMDYIFFTKSQKLKIEIFAFCGITSEPIKIQNCSAPQNDLRIFSFVKDVLQMATEMARNGCKIAICKSTYFWDTLYNPP